MKGAIYFAWSSQMCGSEMIERSLAYALTLWDAERVSLGVLDTLDFMVGG